MDGSVFVESEKSGFTYAILGKGSKLSEIPERFKTLQRLPESGISEQDLFQAGFLDQSGLSYMVLGDAPPDWKTSKLLRVEVVDSVGAMETFSEVQTWGFDATEEGYREWHPWLRQANLRNLDNSEQRFYIGRLGDAAVGVTLTVCTSGIAGIYAVATLPSFRKQGVSATLMKQAIADARARGCRTITLQVKQDSYAEGFYQRLGFERVFSTRFFRKSTSTHP
jgi:GNAT superfamily N-acetyltransferase